MLLSIFLQPRPHAHATLGLLFPISTGSVHPFKCINAQPTLLDDDIYSSGLQVTGGRLSRAMGTVVTSVNAAGRSAVGSSSRPRARAQAPPEHEISGELSPLLLKPRSGKQQPGTICERAGNSEVAGIQARQDLVHPIPHGGRAV